MEVAESSVGFDELNFRDVIDNGSSEFDEWTSHISEIEKTYPDDIERLCLVYDSFLSEFPLCSGYWRKYANHLTRLCNVEKAVEVFERAVQSATYSVGVWVDYCSFSLSVFEDPFDIRRLFVRGLSFVGKDYLCHTLWDKYIEFEFSQQQWSSLALIYIQTLRFPSKKLHRYYESFKKLMAIWEEMGTTELQSEIVLDGEVPTCYKDDEISCVIKDLLDQSVGLTTSKALQKYLYIGQQFYQEACQLDEKIHCFEAHIRRSYFHVRPLDSSQLENWHHYLDFAEMQGDFDWAVKLYERCLIPCANYPEFWMRYVEFMENKGGREVANLALDRATQIFLKRVPMIHIFNARFKEKIGDVFGAHAAFLQCDTESDSSFVEYVVMKANMEKRLGNFDAASDVYKEALEMAASMEKLHALPILYVHFSRLKYVITDSVDAARDILIDGIKHMPHRKLLLEELIRFIIMHGGPRHINVLDSIIANSISPGPEGLSTKDREDISKLYLEFIDLYGTIHDVRKSWDRHIKLFPQYMRTTSSPKQPARGTKTFNMSVERRKDAFVAVPHQPSGDCASDFQTQLPVQDDKLLLPENCDTHSNQANTEDISDQKFSSQENHHIQSDQAVTDQHPSDAANNTREERIRQLSPTVSERPEEDAPEPDVPPSDLEHHVSNEIETTQSSQDYSKENDVQPQYDQEPEQDLKPPSLESLSLIPRENKSLDSIPTTSHECEASQETCMSNGCMLESGHNANGDPSISSPICTQATDSAPIQADMASPSSSASHLNSTRTQPLSQLQGPEKGDGNWHQMTNNDRVRSSRFRGHSHKRHYRHRQVSPQQILQTEKGPKMPTIQNYPLSLQNQDVQQGSQAQNQYQAAADANLTAVHTMSMQNEQQQNFASTCQSQLPGQPVTYTQAQMPQYPMQSPEQYGQMQSSQAYNQMWQYYYFQQQQYQQFLLQQQQQLQLRPQQQQQQQYQEQQQQQQQEQEQQQLQLQQLYLQQQLQLQQQQQPNQQQQQHNQMQQLQLQLQQQFLQQQQQHNQQQQSELQQLQQSQDSQQQQPYQQQQLQQHLYLQQQQLQLQQLQQLQFQQVQPQPLQQHQHQQVLQQQHQPEEKRHHEQHIISSQIQTSNNNYDQKASLQHSYSDNLEMESRQQIVASQGQGATPPRGAGASEPKTP